MVLSDVQIKEAIEVGDILIDPYNVECLGGNSYDVHLGSVLAVYEEVVEISKFEDRQGVLHHTFMQKPSGYLDSKKAPTAYYFNIPKDGIYLEPGILYLGVTLEYTETLKHVPFLEGKSSGGRLGLNIHATAGKGDIGFKNKWTLELSVQHRLKVYTGEPIGQLIYFESGDCAVPYFQKRSAKYVEVNDKPMPSMMHKNFVDGMWR